MIRKEAAVGIIIALAVTTFFAYWQLRYCGFIGLDDPDYVVTNLHVQEGLTWNSVKWAFSFSKDNCTYWHPLTWLSLMTDFSLFGLQPLGFHYVNLLFHIANAIVLFLFLRAATGSTWRSAAVSFMFALHPLNVESVAWITERKTVLSGLFGLLSIASYLRYARNRSARRYVLVFILLLLGLMSKPALISLPGLLLVMDFWLAPATGSAGGAWDRKLCVRLLLEKIPLGLLSVVTVAIAIFSSREIMHSPSSGVDYAGRIANALVSYVAYIGKILCPVNLGVFYPLEVYPWWQVAGSALILAMISGAAVFYAKKQPWLLTGWLWYLVVLFPAIGLVRNGAWPAMADRFVYLAAIGIYIILAWGLGVLAVRVGEKIVVPAAAVSIATLLAVTFIQTGYWKNDLTLFTRTLQVTNPENIVANISLGFYHLSAGDYGKAKQFYSKVAESLPEDSLGDYCNAMFEYENGDIAKATEWLEKALEKDPHNIDALFLLGDIERKRGNGEKALQLYNKLLVSVKPDPKGIKQVVRGHVQQLMLPVTPQLEEMKRRITANPGDFRPHGELALKLEGLYLLDEAMHHYLQMEKLEYNAWQLHYNIGGILFKKRDFKGAIHRYERAVALNPAFAEGHNMIGLAWKELKQYEQAVAAFKRAVSSNGRLAFAHYNLATTYLLLEDRDNARKTLLLIRDNFPEMLPRVGPYLKKLGV